MEQYIEFNGVKIVLTTGKRMSEVQSFVDSADVILSVYPDEMRVLKMGGIQLMPLIVQMTDRDA